MERKTYPTHRVVIGNDAGDADSIVSAIILAYIESVYGETLSTPIVSISRESFVRERPELNLLFRLAGLQDVAGELLFAEDLMNMLRTSSPLDFTLVDHNTFNSALDKYGEKQRIVEIVDHHKDEGKFIETCSGENRTIAFDQGVALVASTCTLVAERLKSLYNANCPYPESIATLLLGVILIDSVGLDESVGKVTQRDRDAVNDLVARTNWMPSESKSYIILDSYGEATVDTGVLFDTLQRAKYETYFWDNLPVERALLYDYKNFQVSPASGPEISFGISTILMSGFDFITKAGFAAKTIEFMHTNQLSLLGIMFAFYNVDSGELKRQLALCTDQSVEIDRFVNDMMLSQEYQSTNLELKRVDGFSLEDTGGLQLLLFDQMNVKPSRKQIGPMLEVVYGSYLLDFAAD